MLLVGMSCSLTLPYLSTLAILQTVMYVFFHSDPVPCHSSRTTLLTDFAQIIKISLEVRSSTEASVDLENQSTGEGLKQTTNITHAICQQTAEWIVEWFYTLSGLVGLIDFGHETVDNIAYTASGEAHTAIPDDVILVDIVNDEANNTIQTHTEYHGAAIEVTFLGS